MQATESKEISVSFIIPVYNVARYLRQCLDSVLNQTREDIEAVCVDDGSTDGSSQILQEYASRDPRIKVIVQENSGTMIARQRAVAAASGKWCFFLDPDDWLEPNAAERILYAADRTDAAIIQIGFDIFESSPLTESQRAGVYNFFNRPEEGYITRDDLLRRVFIEESITWNVIGRAVRSAVCKPAFAEQTAIYAIYDEDLYEIFHIIIHANAMKTFPERLYNYRHGAGISSRPVLTLDKYIKTLGKFDLWRNLSEYAEMHYSASSLECQAVKSIGIFMARTSVMYHTCSISTPEDRRNAFRKLLEVCPHRLLALALSSQTIGNPFQLARMLDNFGGLPRTDCKQTIRRIGIYYNTLTIGGSERVMEMEIRGFLAAGIEVILFTDKSATRCEIQIPDCVRIIYLPCGGEAHRIQTLIEALEKYPVDAFHSHAYFDCHMIGDILACKLGCGIPFYLHYHNVFTVLLWGNYINPEPFTYEHYCLRQCDGVFTLTQVDAMAFITNGIRAYELQNPLSEPLEKILSEPLWPEVKSKTILWVGRFCPEKRPQHAIKIFGILHRAMPSLRFVMIGSGAEWLVTEIKRMAAEEGLQDVLELTGTLSNPLGYYRQSTLLLSTSVVEGFSLVIQEALANGLPVVSYRIPHLTMCRNNPAVIQVPQEDTQAAANAILGLLEENDWQAWREKARKSVPIFTVRDFINELLETFSGTKVPSAAVLTLENLSIYQETLRTAIQYNASRIAPPPPPPVVTSAFCRKVLKRLAGSGCDVKERNVFSRAAQCWLDNGLAYTIRRIFLGRQTK